MENLLTGYVLYFDSSRAWDMRTMESLCRACKYAVGLLILFFGDSLLYNYLWFKNSDGK